MKSKLDTIITVTLVLCALVTTGLVVRREFFMPQPVMPGRDPPKLVKDWKAMLPAGELLGSAAAPVQLMEFADFQCPFCAQFHDRIKTLREHYPTQLAVTYVHFPLEMHQHAEAAARAAECAAQQGRFEAMYDALYQGQKSFGQKAWGEFANAVAIPDRSAFDNCMQAKDPIPKVETGKQLAKKLDVRGTPTIMVNGWLMSAPADDKSLDKMVQAVLAGKTPV